MPSSCGLSEGESVGEPGLAAPCPGVLDGAGVAAVLAGGGVRCDAEGEGAVGDGSVAVSDGCAGSGAVDVSTGGCPSEGCTGLGAVVMLGALWSSVESPGESPVVIGFSSAERVTEDGSGLEPAVAKASMSSD